jgi:hypothetical protein
VTQGILWTPAIEAELERLLGLEENLSYEQIARKMTKDFGQTFTKNSCIGKARRMRMPPRAPKPYERTFGDRPRKPPRPDQPIEPVWPKHQKDGFTIYQLRDSDCRWIYAELMDDPPYSYCGKRTELGGSYCPEHIGCVYVKPGKRWD